MYTRFSPDASKNGIKRAVDAFNAYHPKKTKFCAMVASHDGLGEVSRTRIVQLLSAVGDVKSAGKCAHNDDTLKTEHNNNKAFYLQQFMFNICPENGNTTGYVTEKLFDAFGAGCIPIYNGGGDYLEGEVINRDALLYYTPETEDDLLRRVAELYRNKDAYEAFVMQPRLLPSAVDFIYDTLSRVKEQFNRLI